MVLGLEGTSGVGGGPPPVDERSVTTIVHGLLPWKQDDRIIPPTSRRHLGGTWEAVVVEDAVPLTFVRRTAPPG